MNAQHRSIVVTIATQCVTTLLLYAALSTAAHAAGTNMPWETPLTTILDSIQGLATLKAFGQSTARADKLAFEARDLFRRTMGVLATNTLSRGITAGAVK